MGTQLCEEHALEIVDASRLHTSIRQAVEATLARGSDFDLRTPADAADFLADANREFQNITPEELQFLRDFRDLKDVYFTDTETVGPVLIQVAIVNARREVVFASHINHGCKTVEEFWRLVARRCGGKLTARQAGALRKAFGSPSLKRPVGCDMSWLANQWRRLKESCPSMKVAEWSLASFDQAVYRRAFSEAGLSPDDIQEILPDPVNWILPLNWFRNSPPTLPGYSLGYTCALFAPSRLVWSWHDAVADTLMLYDIMVTRQMKVLEGKVELPSSDEAIRRLFMPIENNPEYIWVGARRWAAAEANKCYDRIEELLHQNPYATRRSLLSAVSFWLLGQGYFRTRLSVESHLAEVVVRHQAESQFTERQGMDTPTRLYSQLWTSRPKSVYVDIPPPTVGTPAQEIVKAAVDETRAIGTPRRGTAWWPTCRRRAHARAGEVPKEEIDLALMVLLNSRSRTSCSLCGADADGNYRCQKCYMMANSAQLRLCKCGGPRAKGKTNCNKCNVTYAMAKRRGYRADLEMRIEQNPQGVLKCFACEGPREVGKILCRQCFFAEQCVKQRDRKEDPICQDCGRPREKYRPKCDDCYETSRRQNSPQDEGPANIREATESDARGKKRKRESDDETPLPAQEPAQEPTRICQNPNCGFVLPPQASFINGRCYTCDKYVRDHQGKERPRDICEQWMQRLDRDREQFENRTCLNPACNVALPPGSRVFRGRCRRCFHWYEKHGSERPNLAARTCANVACGVALPPGTRIGVGGRCRNCSYYFNKYDKERPPRQDSSTRNCINPACGVTLLAGSPVIGDRCRSCGQWYEKHGTERIPHEGLSPRKCINPACGEDLPLSKSIGGRCRSCDSYYKKNQRDRTIIKKGRGGNMKTKRLDVAGE